MKFRKNVLGYSLYMIMGAGLVLSGFATTERGLKEDDRREYDRVVEDFDELGNLGFDGYRPMDYKVAFSNGEKDFVLDYNGGDYEVSERDAVYQGLVGSIYQDGDEFQVVVPEYETWTATGSSSQLSAVIWHESFHAYQNTKFNVLENSSEDGLSETELAERIDGDDKKRELYAKELEILSQIADEENNCDAMDIALEYVTVESERDALLDEVENTSEDFYEMVEGTAYYVESSVVRYENGDVACEKNYLENAGEYVEGNAKYYHHGMLECMLLDELDPEWKDSYNFDCSLSDVIASYVNAK
ncbi:MAG: hypothetical protein K6E27_06230 [Eubacterium sp.]|nr:hypothetical protein [Eubacterium sp.]